MAEINPGASTRAKARGKQANPQDTEELIATDQLDASDEGQEETAERVYGNTQTVDSDLFKLQIASMMINKGWDASPDWREAEHVHWFHTVDSDGKRHTYSTAIGGHFHEMKITPSKDPKKPPIVKCVSGPLHWVKVKVKDRNGIRYVRKAMPLHPDEDKHTHKISYVKSTKVAVREANPDAVNVIAAEAQKTAPIPGVLG